MTAHLWTQTPAPAEYIEMVLCREFGCLPSQIRQESFDDIAAWLVMLDVEGAVMKARRRQREK